ncbi:MAG: YceI family protein [Proteobacteria bacterium]|nr:YceI family protein [Pseudomonadota bacterium]
MKTRSNRLMGLSLTLAAALSLVLDSGVAGAEAAAGMAKKPATATATITEAPAKAAAVESYKIDPEHSSVVFQAEHVGAGITIGGFFRGVTGTFTVGKKPADNAVKVEIDAEGVYTGVQKRDLHLKSPDFLNTKQFPKITFVSTKVVNAGKGVSVTGDLTLHGVTKPVTVRLLKIGTAADPWGNFRSGYLGELMIKRSEYGVAGMPGGVGEKLKLTIAIEGIRQ